MFKVGDKVRIKEEIKSFSALQRSSYCISDLDVKCAGKIATVTQAEERYSRLDIDNILWDNKLLELVDSKKLEFKVGDKVTLNQEGIFTKPDWDVGIVAAIDTFSGLVTVRIGLDKFAKYSPKELQLVIKPEAPFKPGDIVRVKPSIHYGDKICNKLPSGQEHYYNYADYCIKPGVPFKIDCIDYCTNLAEGRGAGSYPLNILEHVDPMNDNDLNKYTEALTSIYDALNTPFNEPNSPRYVAESGPTCAVEPSQEEPQSSVIIQPFKSLV